MAFLVGDGPVPEWPAMRMDWELSSEGPRYVFWTVVHGDVLTYKVPAEPSEDFHSVDQVKDAISRAETGLASMVAQLTMPPLVG